MVARVHRGIQGALYRARADRVPLPAPFRATLVAPACATVPLSCIRSPAGRDSLSWPTVTGRHTGAKSLVSSSLAHLEPARSRLVNRDCRPTAVPVEGSRVSPCHGCSITAVASLVSIGSKRIRATNTCNETCNEIGPTNRANQPGYSRRVVRNPGILGAPGRISNLRSRLRRPVDQHVRGCNGPLWRHSDLRRPENPLRCPPFHCTTHCTPCCATRGVGHDPGSGCG
jgi:hypothetical protein